MKMKMEYSPPCFDIREMATEDVLTASGLVFEDGVGVDAGGLWGVTVDTFEE